MVTAENAAPSCVTRSCSFFPTERPVSDRALVGAVIDDFPTFGVVLSVADRFAELRAKPTTAPQVLAQDRLKS